MAIKITLDIEHKGNGEFSLQITGRGQKGNFCNHEKDLADLLTKVAGEVFNQYSIEIKSEVKKEYHHVH